MKNLIVFFIGFLAIYSCSKQENLKNEDVKTEFPIDSVKFTVYYNRRGSPFVELKRSPDKKDLICYYQLLEGKDGYFCIFYDKKEDVSEYYKYLYQIFKPEGLSRYYDEDEGYNFRLLLADTFNISVNNKIYKIEKYKKPEYYSPKDKMILSTANFHYMNNELGLIAVENNYPTYVVTHNSTVSDSVMSCISKKVIEYMESHPIDNYIKFH